MPLITRASKGSNLTPAEADADLVYLEDLANSKADQSDFDILDAEVGTKADQSALDTLTSAVVLKAPIASPTLTGTPLAPTAAPGTNTTQISTTAFVQSAITSLIASAPGALDTLDELAAALGDDANFATTVTNSLALKAPLASPTFTGVPVVPTAAPGTNTTQAASTAFVTAAVTAAGTASNVTPISYTAQTANQASYTISAASLMIANFSISNNLTAVTIALSNFSEGAIPNIYYTKNTASGCTLTLTGVARIYNMDGARETGTTTVIANDITTPASTTSSFLLKFEKTPGGIVVNVYPVSY